MNSEAMQASLAIDSVAKAVANWTVDQHAQANPQLASRFGDAWRAEWIGHTQSHIHILAQSVAVRRPEVFTNGMRWTCEAFHMRGVDKADLMLNTTCLRTILSAELPPSIGKQAVDHIDAAFDALNRSDSEVDANDAPDTGRQELVLGYLKAILEGDRPAAEAMMLAAFDDGISIPEIYEEILAPAQARLGRMWHRGDITVADEHFGTATTQAIMSQFRRHIKRGIRKNRIVIGTSTTGDLHEIGVRMVMELFEFDGWSAIYLGANTPTSDIIELLERHHADLLALSISTYLTLREAGVLVQSIRESKEITGTKILVGGPPLAEVPDLWCELGADGCASSAQEAVALGNRLISS